ncbi:hypothetical protein Bbelb_026480 [Branchiostoma belcheri]|nr:hypothetical protein Bbelb_026480 [Branchiostoma belcheri]
MACGKKLRRSTTNVFILNLAIADLMFIIFCVPFQGTIYTLPGIKEAIYIRALQPSLNRDGGRHRLSATYDPLLTESRVLSAAVTEAWLGALNALGAEGIALSSRRSG